MAVTKSNVITMNDGREVDFGARGKLKKDIQITGEGNDRAVNITIDCPNGETKTMSFGLDFPLFWEAAAHGISQKITDSITKAVEPDDIAFGVGNQIDQLTKGVWAQRSSEGMVRGFSDLLEAIRRIKGYEVDSPEAIALKSALADKSEDEVKMLKTNSGVKAVLAEIQAEKALARSKKLSAEAADELDI